MLALRRALALESEHRSSAISDGDRTFVRHLTVWRHAIDHTGEMLTELRQEITRRHTGLPGHVLHLILSENRMQLLRRNRLFGAVADPGLSNVPQSGLLETGD